jgi:uncharacterized repeat protein (TIGR01451 family)
VSTDAGFRTYMDSGFASSGTIVSWVKDADPAAGSTPNWTTLSWTATVPANTSLTFQVAASDCKSGPFAFVGPDGTAGTFFTTSGADLSEFDGFRYVKWEAFLATTDSAVSPTLADVTVCFRDVAQGADLDLTKSHSPSRVEIGRQFGYTVQVSNNGPGVADGVEVTDVLPSSMTYASHTATGGLTCTAPACGRRRRRRPRRRPGRHRHLYG